MGDSSQSRFTSLFTPHTAITPATFLVVIKTIVHISPFTSSTATSTATLLVVIETIVHVSTPISAIYASPSLKTSDILLGETSTAAATTITAADDLPLSVVMVTGSVPKLGSRFLEFSQIAAVAATE